MSKNKTDVEKPIVLDEKDKKILRILMKNARTPLTIISKDVRLSHDAVNYRIKRMKEAGIIEVFTSVINPAKLGYPIWGEILISLWNLTEDKHKEFLKYIENHMNISAIWNMSGKYEWWIEIYTRDLAEFNEIVNELKIKFSDIIKDSETFFVLKEVKAWQSLPTLIPGI
jgi:DNA-binding Lrp family transcriptional regulator